ncbi:MAG: hypothetical protein P1U57_11675 [Oleibacter sp.]|nr:hypothetical protein [Thalassolituus sp.]
MANFKVNTTISAPSEIDIPLVRADHHETSNIFRLFFEVFLSVFSALLGYTLSIPSPQAIHYIALSITGIAALAFIGMYIYFSYRAKKGITS